MTKPSISFVRNVFSMRISELLQKESIALGRKPQDKADAIGQMVELLAKSGSLEEKEIQAGNFRERTPFYHRHR